MHRTVIATLMGLALAGSPALAETLTFSDVGMSIDVPDTWKTKNEDAISRYMEAPSGYSRVLFFHMDNAAAEKSLQMLQLQVIKQDEDHSLEGPVEVTLNGLTGTQWKGHNPNAGVFTNEMIVIHIPGPTHTLIVHSHETRMPGLEDGSGLASIIASVRPAK